MLNICRTANFRRLINTGESVGTKIQGRRDKNHMKFKLKLTVIGEETPNGACVGLADAEGSLMR